MTKILSFLLAAFLILPAASASGEGAVPLNAIASIKEIEGSLQVNRNGDPVAVQPGDQLYAGDELVTGERDRSLIEFLSDKTLVKITYNSRVRLTGQETGDINDLTTSRLELLRGLMWGKKRLPDPPLRIRASVAVLAVRGTEFFVAVPGENMAEVTVKEGRIDVGYENYVVEMGKMSKVVIQKGKVPSVEGLSEEELDALVQFFA